MKSKEQLIMENALLRQQVIVLKRQVARPQLTAKDRSLLVLQASRVREWASVGPQRAKIDHAAAQTGFTTGG